MRGDRRNYVMSVEFAMQREMAYRHKLETLGAQQSSSNHTNIISEENSLPSQATQAQNQYATQTPQVTTMSTPNSVSPTIGLFSHPRPPPYFGLGLGNTPPLRPNTWYHGPAPGPMPLAGPSFPGLHSRPSPSLGLAQIAIQKRKQPILGSDYFCDLCQVNCNNPFNMKMHIKGQKHQSKLKGVNVTKTKMNTNTRSGGGTGTSKKVYCELCGISCPDECSLRQHFNGKNHISKLLRGERKMKFDDGRTAMP